MHVPTLIMWGENDHALMPEMAYESALLCDDATVYVVPQGSHWLPSEFPDLVNDKIDWFLSSGTEARS